MVKENAAAFAEQSRDRILAAVTRFRAISLKKTT